MSVVSRGALHPQVGNVALAGAGVDVAVNAPRQLILPKYYCCTNKKNLVGLMLLRKVALGNVYKLKNPKVPEESKFVTWRDDVIVPCGEPVSSRVKTSGLMNNEFIVYDTAQGLIIEQ
ncbi:hypothetical protein K1719_032358 [Acacia pycnantha]|nr:hypothetical protein K1719_032358 [Acacia pycnantha]